MHKTAKISLLSSAAIILTGVTIAISAQFVTSAIGGDAGKRHHREAFLIEITEQVSALEEQSRLSDQQLSTGSQVATQLQGFLNCEVDRGCLSGRGGGIGEATRKLQDMVRGFRAMQDEASRMSDVQQSYLNEARSQIAAARRASQAGDEATFLDHVSSLQAAVSRARGEAERLSFDPGFLAGSDFAAVRGLASRFDTRGVQMRNEILSRPVPVFETMDRYEAAVAYSDKVYMAHVLGVSVELLPLLMFFVVLLSAQLRTDRKDDDEDHHDRGQSDADPDQPILPFAGRTRGYPAE